MWLSVCLCVCMCALVCLSIVLFKILGGAACCKQGIVSRLLLKVSDVRVNGRIARGQVSGQFL